MLLETADTKGTLNSINTLTDPYSIYMYTRTPFGVSSKHPLRGVSSSDPFEFKVLNLKIVMI